jgi:hypothetical protein
MSSPVAVYYSLVKIITVKCRISNITLTKLPYHKLFELLFPKRSEPSLPRFSHYILHTYTPTHPSKRLPRESDKACPHCSQVCAGSPRLLPPEFSQGGTHISIPTTQPSYLLHKTSNSLCTVKTKCFTTRPVTTEIHSENLDMKPRKDKSARPR